ncbi:hypothetical protein [Actinacidiphila rubida]|uniref:Uncharacterized protein n=1 Tax=Actinacidiphila rubida TaxID=310780 RepID=A0A1H8P6N9_9ACTN|nr:hypothetical protein [Actinacidiphila rubida]SEO37497.1 hypothetical protein SAMN05216267_1024138 [Actinacidiphila rubida]
MTFETRTSTPNWFTVDHDDALWFPMPLSITGTRWADVAEWAFDSACDRFLRGGRELNKKVVKKEVLPFAETLVAAHSSAVGKIGAHKFFFHCPDYTKLPVLISIAAWKRDGTREEALQHYAYWGTKSATSAPVAEWFETEALGTGVKAQWTGVTGPGPYDQVNYIFRDDTYDADVHVFLTAWDHDRYLEVVPDLDQLVRAIRCVPGDAS